MKISKQIEEFFKAPTLPIWVPGVDIDIEEDEIIYTAKKSVVKLIENPGWDHDSVSKPRMIEKRITKKFDFIIRDNQVFLIHFYIDK